MNSLLKTQKNHGVELKSLDMSTFLYPTVYGVPFTEKSES